jgi:hypothetical protein
VLAQLVRELSGVTVRQAEAVEEAERTLLLGELDTDAPVVVRHQTVAVAVISAKVCPNRRSDMPSGRGAW